VVLSAKHFRTTTQ